MIPAESVAVLVAAKRLDQFEPTDWRDQINIPDLCMSSSCACVLGQLHDDFCYAPAQLTRMDAFDVPKGMSYDRLQAAWVAYLRNYDLWDGLKLRDG